MQATGQQPVRHHLLTQRQGERLPHRAHPQAFLTEPARARAPGPTQMSGR